ncbi:MAG TPA: SpoIIE family protein phosphatase [Bacteroidia bacterium]|nr:SpoIIE family protein phosphatase [Bacteroidia bacterium]
MKKIITGLFFVFSAIILPHVAYSQASNEGFRSAIKSMITYYNAGQIDSAFDIADSYSNDPDLTGKSKFWFYSGLIYKDMFKKYEKGNPKSQYRERSVVAFQKALELESDSDIINGIKKNLRYIAVTYHNDAVKLLKEESTSIGMSIYAYGKYIDIMRLVDKHFNEKETAIEFSNAIGSVYARMFENENDIHADEYYELAKNYYEKSLELDSTQTSARYNLVVLETNYKTKQARQLKEESERKDQVILNLNAVKELEDVKLHESQYQEDAQKKTVIILMNEQEKKDMQTKADEERKDALAEKEKQKQKLILWLVISGLFIVVVFASLIYRNARQKEKLNKELARLSFVVGKSTNTLMIFNDKMELEWVNNTFFDTYGMSVEQFKEERGTTIIDLSSHPEIEKLVQECIDKKTGVSYESETSNVGLGKRWFQSMLSPIFDEEGKLQNIMVIDSDITELKNIEGELRQKNKDITDSIQYAKRIQQSILPSEQTIKGLLSDSFILYKPKDIVSGDFYWIGGVENNSKVIAAAVDCTGHGVPGALLTIVGNDLLNHIINETGIYKPKDILKEMNSAIISRFASNNDMYSRDGMDMAIVTIDKTSNNYSLSFSGAYNPLYVIRDNELMEMNPLRHSIGSIPAEQSANIIDHNLALKKGDVVYLFSDGYADQLSGKTGKKYMKGRFKQLLLDIHKKPLTEQKTILEHTHIEWRGTTFQTDDMLVMGFKF